MTEDELSNIDMELIPSQSDYLIKLQDNFINLQKNLFEEKENSLNLEKKIFYFENKEKEFNEKIKEIENYFLLEKKIFEDKNIFLEDKLKEKKEKIKKIKFDNQQKDGEINLLKEHNKLAHDLFDQKIADLTNELEQLKNIAYIPLSFIKINNKWKEIDFTYRDDYKCCENECINTNNPIGECIKGNGCVNLINDGNVKYINYEGKGVNNNYFILAENSFKEPQNCINFSLFYFEIKCKIEGKFNDNQIYIGLKIDGADHKYFRFGANIAKIVNEHDEGFNIPQFCWNDNDVFGCGLVYPPEDFSYIFFTQNGNQIGKSVWLNENNESFKPYIILNCCSVETNFGDDLEAKPFVYDFSKHLVPKFY
uniref:Uncharacterized protein n=2 Tax=Meloidogyne enterolobii TaxID=390850 RepID=A0A6V7WPG5_MELEN|nr:unnamed protein product [Meloidogyne enterolobii]